MSTVEALIKTRENSQALVGALATYSKMVENGNYAAATPLLYSLVPSGPDKGPAIPLTREILCTLPPRKALAIRIAHDFCAEFNRNFGVDTQAGTLLKWDNLHLQQFFRYMSTFLRIALGDEDDVIIHEETVIATHQALLHLHQWAEEQFQPKT